MPSKYDPTSALPLRATPELRARLDAMGARLPAALRLPRNSIALAALVRGLDALERELVADPMAVHRALAGETSTAPTASTAERDPSVARAATARAPATTRARAARGAGEALDAAAVLVRFLAAEVKVAPFAKRHGIPRSTLQMWATGERSLNASALARVAKGLDVEGK